MSLSEVRRPAAGRLHATKLAMLCSAVLCSPMLCSSLASAAEPPIDFNRDIRPILSDNCFLCHGPAEDSRQADLRLDLREEAIDAGAIVPEDPASSEIIARIEETDDDLRMPPPEANKTLTAEQKDLLKRWIAQGADYQGLWSLEPLPRQVEVPLADASWPTTDIDRFVLRRLEQADLKPNAAADRNTWLRRVTFDLTGLPPTLAEIEAFVADQSPEAYARVVDRLLASDAHAERMASEWLDVARYSDSYGYQRDDKRFVWPYRDWVIKSFKQNRPYDEFVTWQLAGDLLPNATREQRLATVFCRLHSHKKEGGVAVEEFRVENVADRTHTFASAMLGLTMECARCHDHKYDPITTRDYYQLSSFFANIDERGLISYFTDATPTPAMSLPSPAQEAKLAAAERAVTAAERALAAAEESATPRFESWLASGGIAGASVSGLVALVDFDENADAPPSELLVDEDTGFVEVEKKPLDPKGVVTFANRVNDDLPAITNPQNPVIPGVEGNGILLSGDDSVVAPGVGHIRRHQPLSVSLWLRPAEVTERGVVYRRSGGWDDAGSMGYALVKRGARLRANMVHFWPGDAIAVETDDFLKPDEWRHVTVTYDGSSRAAGLRIYVDGEPAQTTVVQDSLTRTASNWRGGYKDLAIGSRYRDRGFKQGAVDTFRVYDRALTAIEVRQEFAGAPLAEAQADASREELLEFYLQAVDEDVQSARARLGKARGQRNATIDKIPSITVMREQATPRPAFILERGRYDAHGEPVTADTPSALPPLGPDAPRNRLGLARWLFEPDHPLTARVAVNRYWHMLFGAGLVETAEDFGNQGAPPTHPELLDWLARDFVDHGWDVRRMLRMLVLSQTYRQSSAVDPEVRQLDPENRLLSRGPGKPLSAEMVRDNALAVSGLLVQKVGGPPVRPYDLPLAYTPVDADKGQRLYRRSLYTFWKRTSPSPVMMTMNANRREVCQLRREQVTSPLQALVLLNGTQFVEASRVFAEQLLQRHGADTEALIAEAFLHATSRAAQPDEIEVLQALFADQLAEFQSQGELAEQLLKVGNAPRDDKLPASEVAAATVLVNCLLNLDEAIRCR